MKIDPPSEVLIAIKTNAVGTVTRAMVHQRAVELAIINGRSAHEASVQDWEQAKRELTGGPEMDPHEALLESAPESERWDPLPGSSGHIVTVPSVDGEDEDGRSLGETLIGEGMQEAEHDQMLQAAREEKSEGRNEP